MPAKKCYLLCLSSSRVGNVFKGGVLAVERGLAKYSGGDIEQVRAEELGRRRINFSQRAYLFGIARQRLREIIAEFKQ